MENNYYTYIVSSPSDVLYIGMTNNLIRRMQEHKEWKTEWFSKKYGCTRLVYYEHTKYVQEAISREKVLKWWNRKKKIELIQSKNPEWKDLYESIIS